MFFLSGSALWKSSVLWSPVGPLLSGQRAVLRGGLPVGARSRPTFPRELPGVLLLASPFRRPLGPTARSPGRRNWTSLGPRLEVNGRQPAGSKDRMRRGGCTRQGARRGARGARLAVPSTPWTGRAIWAHHQPCSQPRGRHAGLPSTVSFLSIHPRGSRPASPAMPLPHFIWLPSSPRNLLLRCKENAAGTEENSGPGPSKQSAPFSCHSPALEMSALPNWGQPLSDCTIFFAAHPGAEAPAHLAASGESRPGLGVPRSGSQRAAAAEFENRERGVSVPSSGGGACLAFGPWMRQWVLLKGTAEPEDVRRVLGGPAGRGAIRHMPLAASRSPGFPRTVRRSPATWPQCGLSFPVYPHPFPLPQP
ncbi:uncharacterized protein LOC125151579 [Prionailurus viverrinus]|uniref:uncharacterized protein LOC125151579 n=1 Tax=Prionailurus viverrinus TaxID=61388 RepID=UPI001FF467AB|nr:uncharacterized protein LOC125151579 [Prionailurus viverrinus]